jgi:heat shock protein HtpX
MATIYTHQDENIAKTWILMAGFLGVVVGIGYAVSYYFNDPGFLVVAVVLAVVMNISSYWFSDKIVIASAGAHPADPVQYRELHDIVENLAITAGLPKPKVYIVDDPKPNAFATGRNKNHAVVAVTSGLLAMMNRTELEGVLAHELSHIGNKDMLVSTVAVVLLGFVHQLSLVVPVAAALLLAGALGTARLLMSDHTPAQVYTGFVLGAGCVAGCVLVPWPLLL